MRKITVLLNKQYPDDISNEDISNKNISNENISKIEIPNKDISKILIYQKLG
jgi:hypothetical protein